MSPNPPILTRPFAALTAAHFLQALGWASMVLLPLYLGFLGADRTTIGIVMAIGAGSGLALRPVVAWSIDAVGRRPTLLVGTLTMATGMVLLFWVREVGPLIWASRILVGIGEGALFSGYFTLAADIVPERRRTEGLALFGISGLVPLVVGPAAELVGIDPPALRWFIPSLAAVVVASLIPLWFVPEGPRAPRSGTTSRQASILEALARLAWAPLWPVWLATGTFATLVAVFMAFVTVSAEDRGLAMPSTLWFSYTLGAVLVRATGGRLPDRVGPSNMIAPAMAFYAGAFLVAAGAHTMPAFHLAGAMAGLAHGWCFPVLVSQVVTRMPEHLRGTGLAFFTALWAMTQLFVTPLFGYVADHAGDGLMFVLGALLGTAVLAVWAALEHRVGALRTPL